ncbi:MAG: glycosyltransferase [Candidatus Saccharimonadales bacterium]
MTVTLHEVTSTPVRRDSARIVMSGGQKLFAMALLILLGLDAYFLGWKHLLIVLIAASQVFYLAFVGLKLLLMGYSFGAPTADGKGRLPSLYDPDLPVFTVLVPLYKEKRPTILGLIRSLDRLQYPKDRLQVLLLLEDPKAAPAAKVTHEAVDAIDLPLNVQKLTVPSRSTRTKPGACDYGLARARGDYTIIYDAEDRPEPLQLLKAVAGFRNLGENSKVVCLQARLEHWNVRRNLITRMYWVEYVCHFEFILTGLARLGLVPPLGGTSNIFVTDVLRRIGLPPEELLRGDMDPAEFAGAWDPWNVTEDADIAGWLARNGYHVAMIDSFTLEEASHKLRIAANQRARWGKGYFQTGLVHTRRPLSGMWQMGPRKWIAYNLLMLGTPISLMINPIFWGLTITYFATRSTFIESLFPPWVFYVGVMTAVVGNFLMFYQLIIACLHRDEPGNVKYMFLVPLWWAFSSYSMWKGVLELLLPWLRFHWHATEHGFADETREEEAIEYRLALAVKADADRISLAEAS